MEQHGTEAALLPNIANQMRSLLSNLYNYVKEKGIDVVCLSNYKRNIFARLFNPSSARRMIFHSNTPILVIK